MLHNNVPPLRLAQDLASMDVYRLRQNGAGITIEQRQENASLSERGIAKSQWSWLLVILGSRNLYFTHYSLSQWPKVGGMK